MATHKQDTPSAMAPPPTTPSNNSTAMHKQETPGTMPTPLTTPPPESTATHIQETPYDMAPMSTTSATDHAGAREEDAPGATPLDTTIARTDPHVMASQAGPKDSAFLNTTTTALAGSRALQREPTLGADGEELEEGQIPESEAEFVAPSNNHIRAGQLESDRAAAAQNITNSHSSSEGKPNTVCIGGDTSIKKLRPVLITAFIGDKRIEGHYLTTFSGTDWKVLCSKLIELDSFGERRLLLRDHLPMVADHHPSKTPVPKVPQCYNDGEIQLRWDGLESVDLPSKKFCFVTLIERSTHAIGKDGIILLGKLEDESWNQFVAMRDARLSTFFQGPQAPQRSLKRKRETSDDSEPSRPPPSSTFNRPSTRREESNDSTKTSVPFVPAQSLNQMSQDMRRTYQAAFGRPPVAVVQDPVGSYTSLASNVARLGHSSQNPTLRPGMPTQTTRHSHHKNPEAAQNSGEVGTNTEEPMCTRCRKAKHTDAACWTQDPSKRPQKTRNRRATQASTARPPAGPIIQNNHNNHNVNSITKNIHHGDGNIAGSHGPDSARHQRQPRSILDTRSRDYHRRDRRDRRAESPEYESRRGRRYEPREDFHRGSRSRAFSQSRDYPGRDYPGHDYRGSYNHH